MIDEKNLENEEQTQDTVSTESAEQPTENTSSEAENTSTEETSNEVDSNDDDTSIEAIAVEELVEDNREEQLKSAHDDFDWSMTKDHDLPYTED